MLPVATEELIPQTQKKNIRIIKASFLKDVAVTGMPDGKQTVRTARLGGGGGVCSCRCPLPWAA